MSWQERFRSLGKRKEECEKAWAETRKERDQEEKQIVRDFSPRVLQVCQEFAKAMRWDIIGTGEGSCTIRDPRQKDSIIRVYVDKNGSQNDRYIPCIMVTERDWLSSIKRVKICRCYQSFLSKVGYRIPQLGEEIEFNDRADALTRKVAHPEYKEFRGIRDVDIPGLPIPLEAFTEELLAEVLEQFSEIA